MELSVIFDFLNRISNSILGFATSVINFMSFQVADITVFEVLFGASVSVYLALAIAKWAF